MSQMIQLDVTGRRRSPATEPGFHKGRIPPNKGRRYPAWTTGAGTPTTLD
jgi:hypothetical protein